MTNLPAVRGPLSAFVIEALTGAPRDLTEPPAIAPGDPLADDDFQLALYCCYELHYRGFGDVDERWEWDPSLLAVRARLADVFERAIAGGLSGWTPPRATAETMDVALRAIADADASPS